MGNKKKFVGISLIILIIIFVLIVTVVIINKKSSVDDIDWENTPYKRQINDNVYKVTNKVDFYAVENCVNKYLTHLTIDLDNSSKSTQEGDSKYVADDFASSMGIKTQEDKSKALYDMLDVNFIKENKVTTENLYEIINDREGNLSFEAESINVLEGENINTYSVYGKIYDLETLKTIDYEYYIVSIDMNNVTFMLEPLGNNYKNIDEIVLEKRIENIEANNTNNVQYEIITDFDMSLKYLTHYKINAINNPELEYEYLDKEYKEKKFGNIDNYKNYIEINKEWISNINLESYQVKKTDESTRYICIDQYGNYYIFTETAVMNYTVVLDTYTIDLPEFTEKYNSATEQQKVALNIDKFMQAINTKDYKYAYNCLAESYRNNYFKTQEEFETYAKENFYESSTIGYNEFDTHGEYYTYSVVLTDKKTGEQKNKTFIMQLNEGTEFVLSFDR